MTRPNGIALLGVAIALCAFAAPARAENFLTSLLSSKPAVEQEAAPVKQVKRYRYKYRYSRHRRRHGPALSSVPPPAAAIAVVPPIPSEPVAVAYPSYFDKVFEEVAAATPSLVKRIRTVSIPPGPVDVAAYPDLAAPVSVATPAAVEVPEAPPSRSVLLLIFLPLATVLLLGAGVSLWYLWREIKLLQHKMTPASPPRNIIYLQMAGRKTKIWQRIKTDRRWS